jgi:hypothetical protein
MQCQFTRFSSRVDGSVGFAGCTPELSSTEKCALFDLQNKNTRVLIEPQDYAVDSKCEVKSVLSEKSPSTRLRAIFFVLFKQLTAKGKIEVTTFDLFYSQQMSRIIEDVRLQLDPES